MVAIRQKITLYHKYSSDKLQCIRCNRFNLLNVGKNHIAHDHLNELVNYFFKRLPKFKTMEKVISISRYLALFVACKFFLDIYFSECTKTSTPDFEGFADVDGLIPSIQDPDSGNDHPLPQPGRQQNRGT